MPKFPLEDKFAPLRVELDKARDSVIAFGKALAGMRAGAGTAAVRSKSEAAAAPRRSALGGQDAAGVFTRMEREAGRANRQVEGLNKALDATAKITRSLGLEQVAVAAEALGAGLTTVSHAIQGIAVAAPALASVAVALGASVVVLGSLQLAIKLATGETASLKDGVALAALAVDRFIQEGLAEIGPNLSMIAGLAGVAFRAIQVEVGIALSKVINEVGKALAGVSLEISKMDPTLRAALPGLDLLGGAIGSLGIGLSRHAAGMVKDFGDISAAALGTAASTMQAAGQIQAAVTQAGIGQTTQINKLFDKPDSPLLFSKQWKDSLLEFQKDLGAIIPEGIKNGFQKAASSPPVPEIRQAAQAASVEWQGAVTEGLQGGEQLDQAVVNALIMDPEKEGRVITSFRKFGKNLKNVFKESPIAFLGNLFGFAQGGIGGGGGGGGGAGFALGGLVRGGLRGAPSLAHFASPLGLARGGRPRGLHPSDTIAAWLAPGEFVTSARAVAQPFALAALTAINAGRANTEALAAVAGRAPATSSVATGPGFAGGGMVAGGSGGVQTVAVVANEENMQRMLTGGKDAALRFFRDEAANIRGALGL